MVIIEEEKLEEMVRKAVKEELEAILTRKETETPTVPEFLYSMKELADFLHCSTVTAQMMKNKGCIPYKQMGRKVIFNTSEILKAMDPTKRRFQLCKGYL